MEDSRNRIDRPAAQSQADLGGRIQRRGKPNHPEDDGDVRDLWQAMNRRSVITQWTMVALVACLTLYFAQDLLIPLVISLMGYLTLRPTVVRVHQLGLPRSLASMLVIGVMFGAIVFVAAVLYTPTRTWMARAPHSVKRIQQKVQAIRQPLETLDAADESVEQNSEKDGVVAVEIQEPELLDSDAMLTRTGNSLLKIVVIGVLNFFLLATGDDLVNRGLRVIPSEQGRTKALQLARNIHDSVGTYLGRVTLINLGLGAAETLVMWLCGMPAPLLWGALATCFNFVPYVGPLAASGIVFVAAVGHFDSFSTSAVTAGLFWSVTAVEGQFVTPAVVGKSLKLGPVIVLVAVAFWGFVWGVAGVFVAVPLVITMRLIFECFEATRPVATLLGSDECTTEPCREHLDEDKQLVEMAGVQ